ncbi:MAG: cation transporter [Rhodocyclaceae bacterium]|nr:cation transporter [Rhodocyclaceae bacterium]
MKTGINRPKDAGSPAGVCGRYRSVLRVPGMDCPSEEQLIRLRLADAAVSAMVFDLPGRRLVIDHDGDPSEIMRRLEPLGFGAELLRSEPLTADRDPPAKNGDAAEARVLRRLLGINALMFVFEMIAGWWAGSAGLIADAADMFADAGVYGAALYAVGRAARHKLSAARLSGLLQLVLAASVLLETGRRAFGGGAPDESAMIGMSLLALAANIACLLLIARHRGGGVHMRASYIFSANDVLANLGVMVAGALVAWTGSAWPDRAIGAGIGILVLIGAIRILRLR